MKTVESLTVQVTVFIAGDVNDARRCLRQECFEEGLCVTVTPTTFIYTAGAEEGIAIGFVNYPRFPSTVEQITSRAKVIAVKLMDTLYQDTALVVTPNFTYWLTRRDGRNDNKPSCS